jgi:diaminopimelate epimerase
MAAVAVTKMHGTLNDFVILDQRSSSIHDLPAFARRVCDRRGGIGADGLLVLEASDAAHARMRILNPDGSEAEMCGNGMRCAVRYLWERGEGDRFTIQTLSGPIHADVMQTGDPFLVRVDVGVPRFDDPSVVWVGNPHAVIFTPDVDRFDVRAAGEERPDVNVHAAQVVDEHTMRVRHHERGAGLTRSCGTGSVACAAAAMRRGLVRSPVQILVPGGTLRVEWDGSGDAFLTGPAVRVFDGRIDS